MDTYRPEADSNPPERYEKVRPPKSYTSRHKLSTRASMKARPTEYKGVKFRSKSEAMLAYFLDQFPDSKWFYEPSWAQVNGWGPDFVVMLLEPDENPGLALIEYKPKRPTETYLSELIGRMRSIEHHVSSPVFENIECLCQFGSAYDPTSSGGFYLVNEEFQEATEGEGLFRWARLSIAQAALSYRFDLEHSDSH